MKIRNTLILLLTAAIWGVAFVAQSVAMDDIGPLTFLCARSVLGGVVLLPVLAVLRKSGPGHADEAPADRQKRRKTLLLGGVCCGAALCFASAAQQIGIQYTTVGKSGFLTACYILIVPLIGLLFGRKCGKLVWCGVAVALVGLYLLCIKDGLSIGAGDALTLLCALLFSVHILVIDYFSPKADGVQMSCIQFFVCAAIAGLGMFAFEQPSLAQLKAAWLPVVYAGVLSSGAGYTLQIIGQKGMNPTVSSLIMSLESVISVVAGWLILGQALSPREIAGSVLMFSAIVLAQLPNKQKRAA